jgi:hypothetical protein
MIESPYHLNAKAPRFPQALAGSEVITFRPNGPFHVLELKGTMINFTKPVNAGGCTTARGAA